MELEVEDTTKSFKFLSSVLHADAESGLVYSAFHNKNEAAIKAKTHQDFPTYQHYSSFSPASQKNIRGPIQHAADGRSCEYYSSSSYGF